ncbi:MAG: hypothetical protein ACREJ3_12845, partial [Polyangiaceae bacterium]
MDARATYELGRESHGIEVATAERRARALAAARLLLAALGCILVGAIVWAPFGAGARAATWGSLAALVLAFCALVVVHSRVIEASRRAAAAARFHV